ncbi:MAG: hypothetical protein Q8O94_02080 [bacterium]|nr:hypothetical protein [bacterium]
MNNLKNKKNRDTERRMLPFAIEFVKFFIVFTVLIAAALITLRFASAAL